MDTKLFDKTRIVIKKNVFEMSVDYTNGYKDTQNNCNYKII